MATYPPPPAPPPPAAWAYPPAQPSVPRRSPTGVWILLAVAAVASAAAITLGIVAVTKTSASQGQSPRPATITTTAPTSAMPMFDDSADRALCEAIPDLMRERNEADQAFQALPPAQTPERDAAIPGYKAGVQDWAERIQKVLAAHTQPDRYLTRTLQRYIDDMLLYSQNIHPNKPADPFDKATWNVGVVDYGGALGRCQQLGIRW